MSETYHGGCHCGAVRFEVQMEAPDKAFACNCSICSRMGWRLAFTSADTFKLQAADGAVKDYQFHNHRTHHWFCTTCGIRSYATGPGHDGADMVCINLRCVDDLDVEPLPVQWFDGASL